MSDHTNACKDACTEVFLTRRRLIQQVLATGGGAACFLFSGCNRSDVNDDAASGSSGDALAGVSGDNGGDTSNTSGSGAADENQAGGFDEMLTATLFVFDTVVTLRAYCSQETLDEAVARCEFFEDIFSRTVEGSDIWNINQAAGALTTVEPETADIIKKSLDYSRISDGMFDITIGTVSSLWDFAEGVKPADEAIQAALSHIDYTCIQVDTDVCTVQLTDAETKLDLGGIAKGYIADDLARLFRAQGCESALINLGGNAMLVGTKPDGSDWKVGVQDPNGVTNEVIATISCADTSVVTSGLYEREFELDGTMYYHILDPRTGYPVETDLVSSSIITDSSTDADAYATILFLLGRDAALEMLEQMDFLEGLLVDKQGDITMSSGADFELI